jgi:hypothetical protein
MLVAIIRMGSSLKNTPNSTLARDDITSLPQTRAQLDAADDNPNLLATVKPKVIQLLGVQNGIPVYISEITSISKRHPL